MYILESKIHQSRFDLANNITPGGKEEFWRDLDDQIRDFDHQKVSLKPLVNGVEGRKLPGPTPKEK